MSVSTALKDTQEPGASSVEPVEGPVSLFPPLPSGALHSVMVKGRQVQILPSQAGSHHSYCTGHIEATNFRTALQSEQCSLQFQNGRPRGLDLHDTQTEHTSGFGLHESDLSLARPQSST